MLVRTIVGLSFLGISSVAALAADLPIPMKARAAPAPIFSWTGCYVGGDIGGVFGRLVDTATISGANVNNISPAFVQQTLASLSNHSSPSSVTAGVVTGCNYQTYSNFVVGLEGDFGYMGLRKTVVGVGNGFAAPFLSTSDSIQTHWLSTVRGRVGYALPDEWLLFATGGLAMTEARFALHEQSAFGGVLIESTDGLNTRVMTGWTVGGGVEKAFGPWTVKVEYLYADFGRITAFGPVLFGGLATAPEGLNYNVTAHLTAQIVRAGFTYRFWGL